MAHFSDAERAAGNEFCLRRLALTEELAAQEADDADGAPPPAKTRRAPRSRK